MCGKFQTPLQMVQVWVVFFVGLQQQLWQPNEQTFFVWFYSLTLYMGYVNVFFLLNLLPPYLLHSPGNDFIHDIICLLKMSKLPKILILFG